MKQIINNRIYNTETSTYCISWVERIDDSNIEYWCVLYLKRNGEYFVCRIHKAYDDAKWYDMLHKDLDVQTDEWFSITPISEKRAHYYYKMARLCGFSGEKCWVDRKNKRRLWGGYKYTWEDIIKGKAPQNRDDNTTKKTPVNNSKTDVEKKNRPNCPSSNPELREIIKREIEKQGNDLDLGHIDVSQVTNMRHIFSDFENITSLNLEGWDVSNVSLMAGMFWQCKNLISIKLSNWDVSNVIEMGQMFDGCCRLTTLDITNWDVNKVEDMWEMFRGCENLKNLDLSHWNVGNVKSNIDMFEGCGVKYKKWGKRMIKKS